MSWQVEWRDGIWLPQIGWWLDARRPSPRAFVSHAHFDHLAAHDEILCSAGTARLMRDRMPARRTEHILPFGHTEALDAETSVTLHPAGHIFGSAQCLLQHPERGRLLYTGDFKLRPNPAAESCATPAADVVIMESTFGRPHYVFPPAAQVLADIVAFCRQVLADEEVPVLLGYSLGKSQEILAGLAAAALPVMLHPQPARMTALYSELGYDFPPCAPFDPAKAAGHVVIAPPQTAHSPQMRRIRARRTAMLSGWALDPGARFRYQCDAVFPLSDHADYPELLEFVDRVRPRVVWTVHGFAAEFAADLRTRGIEAWALGADNQLEIPLSPPNRRRSDPATPAPATVDQTPSSPASSLDAFAQVAEAVKATASTREKIALLAAHLGQLDDRDAGLAATYLTGRPFPAASELRLQTGWALLQRAVLAVSAAHRGDWRTAYRQFGDSGDTAEALLAARSGSPEPAEPVTLATADAWFHGLVAARGPSERSLLLEFALRRMRPAAAKYWLKIISGDLRIGLRDGLVEEAIALSCARPVAAIRHAHMLCGDFTLVLAAARADTLSAITQRVFRPVQFMLASPEPDAIAIVARLGETVWLEDKYDGIRCQLHRAEGRVELFSRDLNRLTESFPELAASLRDWPPNVVLDGELLAWREGRALPFADLQKRLGRRGGDLFLGQDIPLTFQAYDLLWHEGRSWLQEPLIARRNHLEQIFTHHPPPAALALAPVFRATGAVAIEAEFRAARERGNEGLMAKDPASSYQPGRRGQAWLKLKRAHATLDVVVVAVEQGHGKRRGLLSDYTFAVRSDTTGELVTLGKAYSGLTDAEIAGLTEHFTTTTLETRDRQRRVQPDTVLEVAFDSIQRSARHEAGFALRFPRIVRLRPDKTIREIDTVASCRRLAGET